MMEEFDKRTDEETEERQDVYSQTVRAGRRTYFFDVRATRDNEYFLTITESKKRFNKENKLYYQKHKIFLYQEDFERFNEGLTDVINFINKSKSDNPDKTIMEIPDTEKELKESFTNVRFEDLEE